MAKELINNASFTDLDYIKKLVDQRFQDLITPQLKLTKLCKMMGWSEEWDHSERGFAQVIIGTPISKNSSEYSFQRFIGRDIDTRQASCYAAQGALNYLSPTNKAPATTSKRKRTTEEDEEQSVDYTIKPTKKVAPNPKQCLDLQADAIQIGIKAYHAAIANGCDQRAAEKKANDARQQFLRNNIGTFIGS